MNINSSSLFYKWLVMNAELSRSSLPNNICDLTRFVLLSLFFNITIISFIVMFLTGNFIIGYMIIFGVQENVPSLIKEFVSIAFVIDILLALVLLGTCFKFFYRKIKYTKQMKKVHDIAHNKFCFDVKYPDDK
jgi:hypothetical protein